MFIDGHGVARAFERGSDDPRAAGDAEVPHCHYNLGFIHEAGKSVVKDLDRAKSHYRTAMELGLDMGDLGNGQDEFTPPSRNTIECSAPRSARGPTLFPYIWFRAAKEIS
jgi:TPR repeat protein